MGKITVTLAFDSRETTFVAGETVSGRVFFELKKALKIRGVRVSLKGEEVTGWSYKGRRKGGKKTKEQDQVYSGKQTYFDVTKTVFGKEEGNILNNPTLKPGRHSFPFSYRLPSVLPHSFDAGSAATLIGASGHIRYTARAKVDVPFGTDLFSELREFYVEGLFDVNQANDVHRPSSSSHQVEVTGCCCSAGFIEAGLAVRERSGFIPGDEADVLAQVSNAEVSKIKNCHLQLIRIVTLFAIGPRGKTESREVEHILLNTKLAPVINRGGKLNKVMSLTIPDCVPDVFTGNKFIRIKYAVRLSMQPKGGHLFHLSTPIRIGNRRYPFELHPRPSSSTPADAATPNVAVIADAHLPDNVTQALISADFIRQDCYGATANSSIDYSAPSAPPPQQLVGEAEACVADGDASSTTGAADPTRPRSEFSPSEAFLQDAPPPYNPGFADAAALDVAAAAVATSADVTLSETLHECGICMVNTKDCAFDCGHLACSECAEMLSECHICREKITGKRKIYL